MTENIKEKIKDSHYYKFHGIAPEGFMLMPLDVLEELKNFDTWKEWKNNPKILDEKIKKFCNSI